MPRKRYPSDVSRTQFEKIRPFLESARKKTRPRTVDLYEVFCAVLYLLKSGCQWRMLPQEFPNWKNVYAYFTIWTKRRDDKQTALEQVLKKISRGLAYQKWKERQDEFLHR
jgi:transposase